MRLAGLSKLRDLAVELLCERAPPGAAMEFAAGRFWWGLARDPSRYLGLPPFSNKFIRPLIHRALGIGEQTLSIENAILEADQRQYARRKVVWALVSEAQRLPKATGSASR